MSRLVLLFALSCCLSSVQAAVATLDGRQFAIALVEADTGKAQGTDVLSFAAATGECQAAAQKFGYAKGLCTVAKAANGPAGGLSFRFTMSSAEHGELRFQGVVKGEVVEVTRTWSKPGKSAIVHRFSGQQP